MNKLNLIGLVAKCGDLIGVDNRLLIHSKDDMKHFRETTLGEIVVMGRKTIESLPSPLYDRTVLCLSNDSDFQSDKMNIRVTKQVIDHLTGDVFICGGAKIYDLFASEISEWIVTEIAYCTEIEKHLRYGEKLTRLSQGTLAAIENKQVVNSRKIDCGRIEWRK